MNKKTKVDQKAKRSKNSTGRAEKGVSPVSMRIDLFPYLSFALVLDVFCQRYKLSAAAVTSLLIIAYCRSVTLTLLCKLQYVGGNQTAYALVKNRVSVLLDKGMIVKDGYNYVLSEKCVTAMRDVLVSGERAKILQDIDKRIARSEAYRQRKAKSGV